MPVRPGGCFEFHGLTTRCLRCLGGVIKYLPSSRNLTCQLAEQRQVILAAEEDDLFIAVLRQNAEIVVFVCFPAPLVPLGTAGTWAESNIVIRCEKICGYQAPPCREYVHVPDAERVNKASVNWISVKSICR